MPGLAHSQPSTGGRLEQLPFTYEGEIPYVLCIDDDTKTGRQPSDRAYAKAAESGFRSVLTLRAPDEAAKLFRERLIVEKYHMRHFNIAFASGLPRMEQIDEFLRLVKDKTNHPMLINCAYADRVAAFMMIFRIAMQGWSEDRAVEEAVKSGLKKSHLKRWLRNYNGRHKHTVR